HPYTFETLDGATGCHGKDRFMNSQVPVVIVMVEDDEGHARLIERNIRRSGVNNEIVPFSAGRPALDYFMGGPGKCGLNKGQGYLVLLDLNLPDMSGVEI